MNQNVKITRQQAAEEAKMLEKVFDVVRFLEGDFFEQMQDDPRIGVKIGMCQCYDFWKKNKPCENCTSMKAYAEKKQKQTGIFGCRCFFGDFKIFGNR